MQKINTYRWLKLNTSALVGGVLLQSGCGAFWQGEIEALFAPSSPDNALAVLNSIFFQVLAPLFY